MSSYGLEVYNSDGHLLISSDYVSYRIIEQGSITTRQGTVLGTGVSGTALTLPTNALLFVKAKSSSKFAMVTSDEPSFGLSTGTVGVLSYPGGSSGEIEQTEVVDYFLALPYVYSTAKATSGYGLEVCNELGNLVFSTEYNYTAILANVRVSANILHPDHTYSSYRIGEYSIPNIRPTQDTWICLNEARPLCVYYVQSEYSPYYYYELHRVPFLEIGFNTSGRTLNVWDMLIGSDTKPSTTPLAERPHSIYPTTRNFLVAIK